MTALQYSSWHYACAQCVNGKRKPVTLFAFVRFRGSNFRYA